MGEDTVAIEGARLQSTAFDGKNGNVWGNPLFVDSDNGDFRIQKGSPSLATAKGLRFPLALSWAKGEIGEKVVTIPTKTDKTVEDDEFFTLQLADAQGMELGDERVCTVTIHDPGYDELAAKVAADTATKAEQKTWERLQKAKVPYVRGLDVPRQ